jgi:aryl-alcohol dehydrogenase-like predicted oxidoreductase
MRARAFGWTGFEVSEIGVGCARIGSVSARGPSRSEEIAMLREAVESGINFFDTADIYAYGQSEVILGMALRDRRSEVIIATKGGYLVPRRRVVGRLKPLARPLVQRFRRDRPVGASFGGALMSQDFSPRHLREAVDASLRRLRTDYIDVYQLHSPPAPLVPAADYVGVLEEMQSAGKIRFFGVALDHPDDAKGVEAARGVASLQIPYNLLDSAAAHGLLGAAATDDRAVIARSCYAAGLLADEMSSEALRRVTPDWREIDRLRDVARTIGRPLLQTALQFSLAEARIAVTIVGMRTREHLRANLAHHAADPLSSDELDLLAFRAS